MTFPVLTYYNRTVAENVIRVHCPYCQKMALSSLSRMGEQVYCQNLECAKRFHLASALMAQVIKTGEELATAKEVVSHITEQAERIQGLLEDNNRLLEESRAARRDLKLAQVAQRTLSEEIERRDHLARS